MHLQAACLYSAGRSIAAMSYVTELAYGHGQLQLQLDSNRYHVTEIVPHNPPPLENPQQAFHAAAVQPTAAAPLQSLAPDCDNERPSVCIVIADHTRPVPDHLLIPWIVDELGVDDEQVCILIGTGTHRPSTAEEIDAKLGTATAKRFTIENHSCTDSDLVHLGDSSCGGRCILNKRYVDADIKIVTGFIEPHFFAGFSGGCKGVMPGVAGLDSVRHFHRNSLIADPSVTWGQLEDNALQALTREMVALCPPDCMVNVTLNLDRDITGIFVGDVVEAHRIGCRQALEEAMISVPQRFPIVVTTNSGYPLDQNFYQAVKGISAAARICEPGGHIIIACECSAGLPHDGEFAQQLSQSLSDEELLAQIMQAGKTRHDQWQIQTLLQIGQSATIHLHSALDPEDQRLTRTRPCPDITACIERIAGSQPCNIAVMPRGPLTIPCVAD